MTLKIPKRQQSCNFHEIKKFGTVNERDFFDVHDNVMGHF